MTREERIEKLIAVAKSMIGAPYKYGAYLKEFSDNQTEFDCSSFIQYIFHQVDIELPRSTILQAAAPGKEIIYPEIIMPGDVLFFEGARGHYRHDLFPDKRIYIGHAAISIGNGKIIHATSNSTASGVVEQSIINLPNPPYNVVLVKRFC